MKCGKWSLLALFLVLCAFSSPDPLNDKIINALTEFSKNFPQEKVYLQLDKGYYAAGETIWFKGYVTLQDLPTNLSTNLYVDLVDQNGNILRRDLLPIRDGGAAGSFVLPANFAQGNYRLRAYTAWMLNFDEAFLFRKDIRVFKPDTAYLKTKDSASISANPSVMGLPGHLQYAVQFFPEGGDLVEGVQSVVAFKAINAEGLPLEVSGKVVDNTGAPIAAIRSVHDGMGSFMLTPREGQTYSAVFIADNGDTRSFALPGAKPSGIELHIFQSGSLSRLFFKITRSQKDQEKYNQLKLVAQMQSARMFLVDIDFSKGLSGGMIPLDKMPSGIMQITVMDTSGMPLAERLIFVNNNDRLNIQLDADQLNLAGRAKNVFDLSVPNAEQGNFSISVTDPDQVKDFPDQDNILSDLLLTSDIKGYVYHPGWYFRNKDTTTLQALDLVMMTNGWRRFAWEKIMNNQFPDIKVPAENDGLEIRGRAMDLSNGTINLMVRSPADSGTFVVTGPINDLGDFSIKGLSFHDTVKVYIQGSTGKDKTLSNNIHLYGSLSDNFTKLPLTIPIHPAEIRDTAGLIHFLNITAERNRVDRIRNSRTILLKEVTITAAKASPFQDLEDRYTSGLFKGNWDQAQSFDLTKETVSYTDIFQFLLARVAGLSVTPNQNTYVLSYRNGGSPALFLDEMEVSVDQLTDIPVTDIAYVKFFYPPFLGSAGGGGNGAIAVYTRKGSDNNSGSGGLAKDQKAGYTLVRKFYSPNYMLSNNNNDLPDERTTLYWNPDVKTNSVSHDAEVSFYNNDFTQRFHIVIEGMDNTGRIGRLDTTIESN